MDLGRGFLIPLEKGVAQNGNTWIPSTPDKPVLQSSNSAQSEVPVDQIGGQNWDDLVDIYGELLRSKQPHKFDLNESLGVDYREHNNQGVAPVETYNRLQQNLSSAGMVGLNSMVQNCQSVASVEACNSLPLNFRPSSCIGVNDVGHNIRDDAALKKFRKLNQKAARIGSCVQNLGEVVPPQKVNSLTKVLPPQKVISLGEVVPPQKVNSLTEVLHLQMVNSLTEVLSPQKVNSLGEVVRPQKVHTLAELMGTRSVTRDPSLNVSPKRSAFFMGKPTIICPLSQGENSQVAYASVGAGFPQNHNFYDRNHMAYATVGAKLHKDQNLHVSHDVGCYDLEEMPNSRLSVSNYNLNLPPQSEDGESLSPVRPLPLAPVTPDQQKQSKAPQIIEVPHLLIDEMSTQEKCTQDNVVSSQDSEILERDHSDIVPNSLGTSTAAISTSPKERNSSDGGIEGIDLNKTPQQKTPKRRKHRPKVVVEGKPKRSPKPAAEKKNSPDGNTPAKRKYVRKNATNNSTPPSTDTVKVVEKSNTGPATKSCKRKLNFDLENGAEKESQGRGLDNQEQNNEGSKLPLDLNLDIHNAEWSTELNGRLTSVEKAGNENTCGPEKQQRKNSYSRVLSTNKLPPQESISLTSRDHTLNIIARNLVRNVSMNQCTNDSKYNQVHHHISGGLPQLSFQANTSEPNLGFRAQSAVQSMPQVLEDLVDAMEKQGTKRDYTPAVIRNQHSVALMGSQVWSRGVSGASHFNREISSSWQNGLEMRNKKNVEELSHGASSSTHSGFTTVADFPQVNKSFPAKVSTVNLNSESTNSDCRAQTIYRNSNDTSTMVACDRYMSYPNFMNKFQQQHASSQVQLYSERMAPKTSSNSAYKQITKSLAEVLKWDIGSASCSDPKQIAINGNINSPVRIAVKRQTARQTALEKVSIVDKVLQQEPKNKKSCGCPSKTVQGIQEERRNLLPVDDITNCMKDLLITGNGKDVVLKEQGALVPYRGDSAVVPYDEFDPVKKRQPRPRVDLDPETNRLWNLLMGKEGGGSADTMSADKEKWWEEERKVFRGRVDSFIARMHLVQGDRRFSKWKGSVVDSVIGVFLTQNVSDHLSSSAFMSLAAKFPLKSTTVCRGNGGSPSVEHHEIRITFPDGSTSHQKMVKEPVNGHDSVVSREMSEYRAKNVTPEKSTFLINDYIRRTEEDIISSQSSSESIVLQASEDIRSSSGSNSDAEGGNLGHVSVSEQAERIAAFQQYQFHSGGNSNPNMKPLIGHQRLEKTPYGQNPGQADISNTNSCSFISGVQHYQNSWPNLSLGMHSSEADVLASLLNTSTSTFASKDSDITNGTGVECMHEYVGQSAESGFTVSQDGRTKFQPLSASHGVQNNCHGLQTDSLDECHKRNGQYFIKQTRGKQQAFHQQSTFSTDPKRPAESFSKQQSDNSKHSEVETEIRLGNSEPSSKISATTSNTRKRKAEKEKAESFNWDTLRKQVQSKIGIRERSREAMDSIDYEAIQNADVREISDTIKERGMNNMLAERMKDFLNRLVQDHESMDLEWLRDVEPDKVKDYLLSIRGIGLKSVECVRLLTLHHLAFPVDTNVGRIAVRLGWVPLQPLPESLQLHLLELYPVLETIQKYLWPRLCKLDQETLYELHYQMITFGKVFCTKREPNCNACPMRGECRHFASAFASARLALPAPQERHIVSSTAPVSANRSAAPIVKPMALLPSENNIELGKGSRRDCEPVIEEPTTPELPIEVAETDIEDAFYEDPDEIPVIKLDIQEFTTNLQSFMQEQMEMGGGDLSKALVALSPEFASIPIPKLKNISRLRTEHLVYELPDSHPLLKGMDRREPDDPSPYLLAIWTPGETADSIQPPESKCSYTEGGGLCNKKTCFSCNSTREAQAQTVRGTILIPCRTAMRGSFPLNGTYFQVNEVFADHESSLNPIDVPRNYLWNLPRRTVFFGTSVTSIFKGLSTEDIQFCFWKGFVCVRGFDQKTRAPRPLRARLHFTASKMAKQNK
ncbi:hypothetical protein ACS0TY_000692 [Phlomoides rotata]